MNFLFAVLGLERRPHQQLWWAFAAWQLSGLYTVTKRFGWLAPRAKERSACIIQRRLRNAPLRFVAGFEALLRGFLISWSEDFQIRTRTFGTDSYRLKRSSMNSSFSNLF
jgi:hypothetical protein